MSLVNWDKVFPETKRRQMPVTPKYLHAQTIGRPVGVDRKNNVLRGFVVAQLGPFKSEGRGEFDLSALQQIVTLGNKSPRGLKSRFTHPDMSSDGLGKHLGRARDFSLSTAMDARTNKKVPAVRADLTFDKTALDTPPEGGKAYGSYVMDLAESDPDAMSSSLVLEADVAERLAEDGTPELDKDGNELPPMWMPTRLHATDLVDTGDAVDGLLSAQLSVDGLPMVELWQASAMLDEIFDGQPPEVIYSRCTAYLKRYLGRKFGKFLSSFSADTPIEPIRRTPKDNKTETPKLDNYRKALWRMAEKLEALKP